MIREGCIILLDLCAVARSIAAPSRQFPYTKSGRKGGACMPAASQREMAGFLLGLGVGLIVGIVWQPRGDDQPAKRGAIDRANSNVTRRSLPVAAKG